MAGTGQRVHAHVFEYATQTRSERGMTDQGVELHLLLVHTYAVDHMSQLYHTTGQEAVCCKSERRRSKFETLLLTF